MNIGEASARSGLPAKTIRYYEEIGLLKAPRSANGYRHYGADEIHKLTFLHRARSLGFTIEDCRALLDLYEDRSRASADVKALAAARIVEIEAKIRELQAMRSTLKRLATACHGDGRPDCPILEELAGA